MYESGALCALAEALPGVDFTALDGYVGVSAGSFIAAGLANGTSPRQLCTSFVENDGPRSDRIHPGLFFRPAFGGCAQRLATVPRLLPQAGYSLAVQRGSRLAARGWRLASGYWPRPRGWVGRCRRACSAAPRCSVNWPKSSRRPDARMIPGN